MSDSNVPHSHWKPNLLLGGNNISAATNYQNILKLANSNVPGSVIHQHHSSHQIR